MSAFVAPPCVSVTDAEITRVRAILTAGGVRVSPESLRARLDGDDSGVLLCGESTASWVLDGGALHLYDLVVPNANKVELDALVATLQLIARARFAAVLVATLYEDAPLVEPLVTRGFVIDDSEQDARASEVVRTLTLLREVT